MEMGTAILLSSVFLGTVGLYIATRDRWRWRAMLLRGGVGLALMGVLLAGGLSLWNHRGLTDAEVGIVAIEPQMKFAGVTLGSTVGDVIFRKGDPAERKADKKGEEWYYSIMGEYPPKAELGRTYVRFIEGKVSRIYYAGNLFAPLPGVFSSQEDIELKLGTPDGVAESPDYKSRILSYDKYHVFYFLELNQVRSLGVYDPKHGRPALSANE